MAKDFDPEDPTELVSVAIPGGDSNQALDCIVQEYLPMGWDFQQIMVLFRSPHYGGTHQIYRQMGEGHVKDRVQQLVSHWLQGWIQNKPQREAPYA